MPLPSRFSQRNGGIHFIYRIARLYCGVNLSVAVSFSNLHSSAMRLKRLPCGLVARSGVPTRQRLKIVLGSG